MGEALPHLWHFRVSHYNEKVRWALDLKRIAHRRTSLVPALHSVRAQLLSRQSKLPILELDGKAWIDSTRIIEEIERRWPTPPLYPADAKLRERALEIEHWFDEEVAPPLRRLFWSSYLEDPAACTRMATDGESASVRALYRALFFVLRPAMRHNMGVYDEKVDHARDVLRTALDRIANEVQANSFFVGDAFSIADLTAAAVLTAILRPPQFPYPLPDPWPRALVEVRDSVLDHPGARWVMNIYATQRPASAEVASEVTASAAS